MSRQGLGGFADLPSATSRCVFLLGNARRKTGHDFVGSPYTQPKALSIFILTGLGARGNGLCGDREEGAARERSNLAALVKARIIVSTWFEGVVQMVGHDSGKLRFCACFGRKEPDGGFSIWEVDQTVLGSFVCQDVKKCGHAGCPINLCVCHGTFDTKDPTMHQQRPRSVRNKTPRARLPPRGAAGVVFREGSGHRYALSSSEDARTGHLRLGPLTLGLGKAWNSGANLSCKLQSSFVFP